MVRFGKNGKIGKIGKTGKISNIGSPALVWMILGIEDHVELCNYPDNKHNQIKGLVKEWNSGSARQIQVNLQAPLNNEHKVFLNSRDWDDKVSFRTRGRITEVHAKGAVSKSEPRTEYVTALRFDFGGQPGTWRSTGAGNSARRRSKEYPSLVLQGGESIVEVKTAILKQIHGGAGDLVSLEMVTSTGRKWGPWGQIDHDSVIVQNFGMGSLSYCSGQQKVSGGYEFYRLNFHWSIPSDMSI